MFSYYGYERLALATDAGYCVKLGGECGKVLMSVLHLTDLESTPSCVCHSLSIEPHVLV